jgi:hypothetical protein
MSKTDNWHSVITNKKDHWQSIEWCTKQFGRHWSAVDNRDGVWCYFWAGREQFSPCIWHFERERDAVWFNLRWL